MHRAFNKLSVDFPPKTAMFPQPLHAQLHHITESDFRSIFFILNQLTTVDNLLTIWELLSEVWNYFEQRLQIKIDTRRVRMYPESEHSHYSDISVGTVFSM
jgi:hypothetical protein